MAQKALKAKEKELGYKIIRHFLNGVGIYETCDKLGISYMMYQRKFKHNGWFQAELEKAKVNKDSVKPLHAASEMIPLGDDPEDDSGLKKRMFLESMEANNFKVNATLLAIGVSKDRYYKYWKKDANFLKAVEVLRAEMLDYYIGLNTEIASDSKHGMAQSNSTIFAIKCLGKDAGWDERSAAPSLNFNFDKDAVDAIVRAAGLSKLDDVIDAEVIEVSTEKSIEVVNASS